MKQSRKFNISLFSVRILFIISCFLCFSALHVFADDGTNTASSVSVSYRTHVQSIGWQNYVTDGGVSGTTGKSLRLEGIDIQVEGNPNLGIKYKTHVQSIGWQDYVSDGALSGTAGKSLRLEAIKIELTGADSEKFDVYYRVHAQDYGWLNWAKNGNAAGTEGLSKRLEAIQIKIVPKGTNIGESTVRPFVSAYGTGKISYRTHVQNYGWQNYVTDGAMSGTTGKSLRLEAINIRLGANMPSGSIVYSTHVQNYGWMKSVFDGRLSGTTGESKRLEAIKISLTGDVSKQYNIYYRVHVQNIGWLDWAKNGESAGSAGFSYRLEGIEIRMVAKGAAAPGNTAVPFIDAAALKNSSLIGRVNLPVNAKQAIVVTSNSYKTIQVKIYCFEKVNGIWKQIYSMPGVIGKNGFSSNRTEGDMTTPVGTYTLGTAFGKYSNPGTLMPYRKTTAQDIWSSDDRNYNAWVTDTSYEGEHMLRSDDLYDYGFVINFNIPERIIGKGSGIFFHCWRSFDRGTAGCVAADKTNVINILKWLDPGKNPVIIEGPEAAIFK